MPQAALKRVEPHKVMDRRPRVLTGVGACLLAAALTTLPLTAQAETRATEMDRETQEPVDPTFAGPTLPYAPYVDVDPSAEFLDAQGEPRQNFVQGMVSWAMALVSPTQRNRGRRTALDGSFHDLQEYQDIYLLAAGWNGDRFFQYRLGLMFEDGTGALRTNKVAAYYWYSLAAAQGLEIAKRQRLQLLAADRVGDITDRQLNDVYLKFIEVYIFGGPEAQFRLGEILESDFFDNEEHDQDVINVPGNYPSLRLIQAFAAYKLAKDGGYNEADRAMTRLSNSGQLTDIHIQTALDIAREWSKLVGTSPNQGNPFSFTGTRATEALARGNEFQDRRNDPLSDADEARSWLREAQAHMARGDIKKSKIALETAIRLAPNSRAALEAQQSLQSLTTTCSAAPPDLRPSEYRGPAHPLDRVREIRISTQQEALSALGHYDGRIDGRPGPRTRSAVRRFLTALNVDVKDFLNAHQVVELICKAAQLRGHAPSQNVLGFMYANGIGVVQDEDLAHHWFSEAAQQAEPSAVYNVGIMYATERGLPRNMVGHPQNCMIAYSYLREAQGLRHPLATKALRELSGMKACKGQKIDAGYRAQRPVEPDYSEEDRYYRDEDYGEDRYYRDERDYDEARGRWRRS